VDYRGVHARRRLEKDELILEVPLDLIMTTEVAKESEIGMMITRAGCTPYSDHSWLAALLLQEKYRSDSKYKPYIDCLPVHYRNMPIFFDDDELKWLKGSFTIKMIEDRKYSLKMEYDNIVKYVPEFARYHHLDFFWARIAVITRVFGFEVKGKKTEGLVAMADMLNHKRPNETSWTFDDSRNAFTITTTKRLLKSAQIFDSYGRKCNSRFFVNYGFALDFNEDNQVALFFDIPKDDQAYPIKSKLLGGQRTRRFQVAFEHKERCTKKCVSFLRIAHATIEELLPLTKIQDVTIIDPVNFHNEARVMQVMAKAAQDVLKEFTTSLDDDNKLLADEKSTLTMNQRNCVVMRRGEKEVLQAYVDLAKHLAIVENYDVKKVQKYVAQHIKGRGREPTVEWRMEKYFEEFWIPLIQGKKIELEEMNNSLGE
jgi:histone-lysine N-methyltransferase SETD3